LPDLKGIIEVLKKVKHRSPSPKICPKCGSYCIYSTQNFGIFPISYKCKDCGYEGTLIIEIDAEKRHNKRVES
jgi:predicted RNA-binding Zn-ribbon protein involved in translation (DUF1610 family)